MTTKEFGSFFLLVSLQARGQNKRVHDEANVLGRHNTCTKRDATAQQHQKAGFFLVPERKSQLVLFSKKKDMSWCQTTIRVGSKSRGCHLVTNEVVNQVPDIKRFKVGLANFFSAFELLSCSTCYIAASQ
jgi:hypothetical protein